MRDRALKFMKNIKILKVDVNHPLAVFVRLTAAEFSRNQCVQRASAMAYASLLALVPLLTLSLSLFANFVELSKMKQLIQTRIFAHFIPQTGSALSDVVSAHLDRFVANAAAINVAGIIGLTITVIALFTTVENSFNYIWRVERHRNFFTRYNAFCGMLLGIPLLIGGSLYLSSMFNVQSFVRPFPFVEKVAYTLFPLVMTWCAFVMVYHQIPNTRVHWSAAVLGGVTAGSLWELAKFLFGIYVSKAVNVNVVYGSLGALPLFLCWLYLTWAIVLLGAQVGDVAQHFEGLADEIKKTQKKTS